MLIFIEISNDFLLLEYEAIVEKHRKEKKELREKIIGLKRASNKKDKKKLQDEIGKYEEV